MSDITGNTSDGYHTFDELYEHRAALFACLCLAYPLLSWKSKLHSDGTSLEGWFIAGMYLPSGEITYHIQLAEWDLLFKNVQILSKAPLWDGHTPADVVLRLRKMAETKWVAI
jgi:hypothetical protein